MRVAVSLALLLLAACDFAGQGRSTPSTPSGTVLFVPLGEVPPDLLQDLVAYYKGKHGLVVGIAPAVAVEEGAVDRRLNQVVAEELVGLIERDIPHQARGVNNVLIGITAYDMRIRAIPSWRFAFAYRQGHRAVVSMARMDPVNLGEAEDDALLRTRLRKMVSKQIGLLYFGMPESSDRRSVLYSPILGVDDLDSIGEELQ